MTVLQKMLIERIPEVRSGERRSFCVCTDACLCAQTVSKARSAFNQGRITSVAARKKQLMRLYQLVEVRLV